MSEAFAYVGIKPCGHMVAATVDRPEYAKDNAKEVGKWMRLGWRVERIPVERVRTELHFCDCLKKKKPLSEPLPLPEKDSVSQ